MDVLTKRRRRRRLLTLYLYYLKVSYSEKRWHVRPIFANRVAQGDHYNLLREMVLTDHESYFNYLRMSPTMFDELLTIVGPSITKQYFVREPILPAQRLAVTLRFLASGDSYPTLSFAYRLGKSTISKIITETCAAIWKSLSKTCFFKPTTENWKRIALEFEKQWNFPHCIGAIDGKHIAIQAFNNSGSENFNYKDFHSLVLMAVCDANYVFTVVDIGASGRQSDGGIFKNSLLGKGLSRNLMGVPLAEQLPKSHVIAPYVLVGDKAFPLTNYLLRPYPGRAKVLLPPATRVFNYRLSRARRVIENAFGILVSRWRIFRRPIIGKKLTVVNIIKAATCLHNWVQTHDMKEQPSSKKYCPPTYVDYENRNTGEIVPGEWRHDPGNSLRDVGPLGSNRYSDTAAQNRDHLKDYFMNEGIVPWQWISAQVDLNTL